MMASCQYVERRVSVQVLIISVKRMESGENYLKKKERNLVKFSSLLLLFRNLSGLVFLQVNRTSNSCFNNPLFISTVDGSEKFI
jgi:hypothetical protein